LYSSILASESSDSEFLDSLNNNGLELGDDIFLTLSFLTLLSSEEIDSLFEGFSVEINNPLYIVAKLLLRIYPLLNSKNINVGRVDSKVFTYYKSLLY